VTALLAIWVIVLAGFKARDLYRTRVSTYKSNETGRNIPDWKRLVVGRIPDLGSSSASFPIIEFSDYQCPYCGMADPVLVNFVSHHHGDVVVYRYDMPLQNIHPHAYVASIAANCAELQGIREPYQSLLFQHQKEFASLDWTALARQSGVSDIPAFARCLHDETPREYIQKELETSRSLNITSTPSFIINGKLTEGISEDRLEALYRDAHRNL